MWTHWNSSLSFFTRLIFGALSSPFLLNATISKHGQSYEKIDEEFARIARKKFYVDDLNCGVNDVEEGFDLYKKMKFWLCKQVLLLGNGAQIMKHYVNWYKNVKVVIIQDRKLIKSVEVEKVLGVEWNEYQDILNLEWIKCLKMLLKSFHRKEGFLVLFLLYMIQ